MASDASRSTPLGSGPLADLDEWEIALGIDRDLEPSGGPGDARVNSQTGRAFRDYGDSVQDRVREFYRLNHTHQTREFVQQKKQEFLKKDKRKMSVWEAMEYLNTLVDDSDPDTDLSQIQHLMQTAEAIRADGKPRWFILAGLIHDLGKVLCLWGEPQWAVVGDTFPVGCAHSSKIVFPEFFALNSDSRVPEYQTKLGVYEEGAGLDTVDLSWGHDEYLYHVVKDYLPDEALAMIRYHSFYVGHRECEYEYLMNDRDRELMESVREFNPYDLYSKGQSPPDVEALKPFYIDLIDEYFPPKLAW